MKKSSNNEQLYFPRLNVMEKFDGIVQLDSEEKILAASAILNNQMAKYYIPAAQFGESFLFFVELKDEKGCFEIASGRLIQLSGYENMAVTKEMKDLVESFIKQNPCILKESIEHGGFTDDEEFNAIMEIDREMHISF